MVRGWGSQGRRALAVSAVFAGLLVGGCAKSEYDSADTGAPGPTFLTPTTEAFPTVDSSPFAGLTGTARSWTKNPEFSARLAAVDPAATDEAAAAAAYDAVMLAAISAEVERSDAPGRIAAALPLSTTSGTPCIRFIECRALALKRNDLAYIGYSGSAAIEPSGLAFEGEFSVVRINANGEPVVGDPVGGQLDTIGDSGSASASDPRFGPLPDGVLRIGTLLPGALENPIDALASQSAMAGVQLALTEINADTVGGVIGEPIELLPDTTTSGSAGDIRAATRALIDAGADVVIGPVDQTGLQAALPLLDGAGIVLISPLDTTPAPVANATRGRYFRTTASVELLGRVLGQLVSYDGITETVLVVGPGETAKILADNVAASITGLDGEVTVRVDLVDAAAASNLATMVAAASPSAIVIVAEPDATKAFVEAMDALKLGPTRIGWYGAPWLVDRSAARLYASK